MVQGSPIGGWLILIALGLIISPFRLMYDFFSDPDIVTGAGAMSWFAMKRYGVAAFSFLSQIYNIARLFFSVLLIVLFFQRRTSFPRLMSITLGVQLLMVSADTMIARAVVAVPGDVPYRDVIQSVFAAAIWIPYMNMSQRVKETFVMRGPDYDPDDENGVEGNEEEKPVEAVVPEAYGRQESQNEIAS
jgi:hypothetical protein